jgi:hypothetical protein
VILDLLSDRDDDSKIISPSSKGARMRRISHWSLGHEPIRLIDGPTVTSGRAGIRRCYSHGSCLQPDGSDRQSTASKPWRTAKRLAPARFEVPILA